MLNWLMLTVFLWISIEADKKQTVVTHEKIVGGSQITIFDAPYQVSIRSRKHHEIEYGTGHLCGGTVISQRVICTAAHCVAINNSSPIQYIGARYFIVIAGSSFIKKVDSTKKEFLVQEIIGHPLHNQTTLQNDIALLFLNSQIPWNYIAIKVLPLGLKPVKPGTFCRISGWGNKAERLNQAIVPVYPQKLCSFIYDHLPSSQLCAGYLSGGIDACVGDSGGPLVCNGTLTGIISWGVDCARAFYPGAYTNVSYYADWIKKSNSSLDYSNYTKMSRYLRNTVANSNTQHIPKDFLYVVIVIQTIM